MMADVTAGLQARPGIAASRTRHDQVEPVFSKTDQLARGSHTDLGLGHDVPVARAPYAPRATGTELPFS